MNDGASAKNRGVAIITGASGGIGLELARLLARDGYDLVMVARSAEKLEAHAGELSGRYGVAARAVAADLENPAGPRALMDALGVDSERIAVLVNNAGFGLRGPFSETEAGRELAMIQLNVSALTHLTKLVLPGMLARRRGRILNVASTAAFQPGPYMAVYYATKAYVLSFSEAVAAEVAGSGVTVTVLCPGPTHTGFAAGAHMEQSRLFTGGRVMSAEAVAEVGIRGMMAGKRVVIAGRMNRAMALGTRLVPRTITARIAGALNGAGD